MSTQSNLRVDFPKNDAESEKWQDWCRTQLMSYSSEITQNPMTNSVQRLSHDLAMGLEDGDISFATLNKLMNEIGNKALLNRAARFKSAHKVSRSTLHQNCEGFIDRVMEEQKNESFEAVKDELERTRAGIVFTGHPTFAISEKLRGDFIAHVEADSQDERALTTTANALCENRHSPDSEITIESEHKAVCRAIENATYGLNRVNEALLLEAQKRFPDQWFQLNPAPLSIATWVGYDLDGRTDIHWGQTLTIRLREKAEQLDHYVSQLKKISGVGDQTKFDNLIQRLQKASKLAYDQAQLFSGDLNQSSVVVEAANALTQDHPDRLISLKDVMNELETVITQTSSDDAKMALCLVRGQMKACGLGMARIHLRVNAAQVRSALRHDFGVDPDADFIDRGVFDIAARQAAQTVQHQINFASVFLEKMTARRQFMLCAQILKHVDADTPIRFLIAECEAPATVMGAVYLARAYGVADMLDISPLFETPSALERGGRFMERLLQEDEFVAYAKTRQTISIQLGFSDSGRFMGQVAADLAIERLHILLARVMAAKNLTGVEALVFNTNGESMGRGGFPGSIEERLHHLITPWTRASFAKAGVPLNVESAFQGGEGFLHFQTPDIALKTMSEIFRVSFQDWQRDEADMFYRDINFSWDYYRGVKAWQEDLFDNPDYTKAISSFGQKFLFTTGSRKVRRQSKGVADMSPRALRAIPHNAILQQMAIPVNVACGTGTVIRGEEERFVDFVKRSDRMQRLISLAEKARNLTSLPAFLGYANIYNASYWTRRATSSPEPQCASCYLVIAEQLQDQEVFIALSRLANSLGVDLAAFDQSLNAIHGENRAAVRHEDRLDLHILHALRQAVIMHALILIAQIPSFSGRHEISKQDLVAFVLHLEFDEVVKVLRQIFPADRPEVEAMRGIEEITSVDLKTHLGYPQIQEEVIEPLNDIRAIIQEAGVAISHFYGAYG